METKTTNYIIHKDRIRYLAKDNIQSLFTVENVNTLRNCFALMKGYRNIKLFNDFRNNSIISISENGIKNNVQHDILKLYTNISKEDDINLFPFVDVSAFIY